MTANFNLRKKNLYYISKYVTPCFLVSSGTTCAPPHLKIESGTTTGCKDMVEDCWSTHPTSLHLNDEVMLPGGWYIPGTVSQDSNGKVRTSVFSPVPFAPYPM